MTIETLVGLDDCTLMIYRSTKANYHFSIFNTLGQIYTCNTSFPTLGSAKLMGTSAVKRLAVERE